jgi:methionine--tRNA ligase beta chain
MITYEEFKKVEMKVGEIVMVERIAETDKLLRLMVDFGEELPRQIVSGIASYFPDPQILLGKKCAFVTNLEPRMIRGFESQGMIMAVGEGESFSLLETSLQATPGSVVK